MLSENETTLYSVWGTNKPVATIRVTGTAEDVCAWLKTNYAPQFMVVYGNHRHVKAHEWLLALPPTTKGRKEALEFCSAGCSTFEWLEPN